MTISAPVEIDLVGDTVNVYGAVPPVTVSCAVYGRPGRDDGTLPGHNVYAGQPTTIEYGELTVHPSVSMAVIVNGYVPVLVGTPLITPVVDNKASPGR